MGEAKQRKTATQRLIEQFPLCALCGGSRPSSTREHVPPTALFERSHRPDDIVVPACDACNGGTSTADLVVSIVSRWRYDPDASEFMDHAKLVARLKRQAPAIITEWTKFGYIERKHGRQHLERNGVHVPLGTEIVSFGKGTIRELNLFSHKLALGLYFDRFREPLPADGRVYAIWRTKEDYQRFGIPPEVLAMMPHRKSVRQGRWDTRRTFEYRYVDNTDDGILGFIARVRMMFIIGFASRKSDDRTADWVAPPHLLALHSDPAFEERG
jgi:hypothetical protein